MIERRVRALSRAGINTHRDALRCVVDDNKPIALRRRVASVLGVIGNGSAAGALTQVIERSSDRTLVWECAKSLVYCGRYERKSLLKVLRTTPREDGRAAAAWVLGTFRDFRAVDALMKMAEDADEEPRVRGHAIEALGRIGARRMVPRLINPLRDASEHVRFWTAYALGEIGDARAIKPLRNVARRDLAEVEGWWPVGVEARAAIENIVAFNEA